MWRTSKSRFIIEKPSVLMRKLIKKYQNNWESPFSVDSLEFFLFIYQSYILSVSAKRASLSLQLRTTINIPFFRLARQDPALAVCPVLIPCHPLFNRLLVFHHRFLYLLQYLAIISSSKAWGGISLSSDK